MKRQDAKTPRARKRADKPAVKGPVKALVKAKRPASKAVTLGTGATGFLGAHLLRELAAGGEVSSVRALVQSAPPPWLEALGVEIVAGSVTDAAAVQRALDGVQRVYHLAGLVSHKPADAHRMHEIHVQ